LSNTASTPVDTARTAGGKAATSTTATSTTATSTTTAATAGAQDRDADLASEQEYVSGLYGRLDGMRALADERLATVLRESGGTQEARSHRESAAAMYGDQLAQLNAVENGLCFGRLDFHDGERRYVGRIGIFDDGDHQPLLLDWRAPAARPFYLATAASPEGVDRRRHIRTARRKVVELDDEVLDLTAAAADRHSHSGVFSSGAVTGEAALLAALTANRTGRMGDIVSTIQAEQDAVIRADLNGVLVVQGGPGTGKTAVALHRAAYLLYTYRRELSSRGVLILGPNTTFLRYISHVLPSLAETGVLLRTLGDLYPGVSARREESAAAAEIKGRPVMTDVIAAAIRDRQRVPDEPLEIVVDAESLWLGPATVTAARARARRTGKPHNLARPTFDAEIVKALGDQVAERIGHDPYADDPLGGDDAPGDPNLFDPADMAEIRRGLRKEPEVLATLDWLWPVLTPEQLIGRMLSNAARLVGAILDRPLPR